MRTYHIGILVGGGIRGLHDTGDYHSGTVVVQARRCLDNLSSEIREYLGERETTKARLKSIKPQILASIQKRHPTWGVVRIAID